MHPTSEHAPRQSAPRASALRGPLRVLVGLGIAALLANTWIVGGLVAPAVVSGGSMAPALLGAHRQWQCVGCRLVFACNLESLPDAGRDAICPRCGAANDPQAGHDLAGQRIWIDRTAFAWRTPKRWEAVVFRSPDQPEMLCLKRVVGLPGEVVDLRAGDVVIDGRIARKDWQTQRAVAVEVSGPVALDRWHTDSQAWSKRGESFVFEERVNQPVEWLTYQHAEPMLQAADAAVILDGSPFDQSESRRLNEVADFALRFGVRAHEHAILYLRAHSRGDTFDLKLQFDSGQVVLSRNGQSVCAAQIPNSDSAASETLEVAIADQQLRLAIAGKPILSFDFEPPAAGEVTTALAIGAGGGRVEIRDLCVFRDVFYTPDGRGRSQYRLGEQEYFVLGDNSAHSADSRSWTSAVSAGLLLGPALIWPALTW